MYSVTNGAVRGLAPQAPLIEICRKPNYKPRSTSSFSVCQGAHFFYDLMNVNATGAVWRHNGNVVPGRTHQRLEFAAIAAGDAGVWACTLTNSCGVTEPPPITITVNAGAFTDPVVTGDTLLCGTGDAVVLSGNTGGTWNTGATTQALTVTQPGAYYVYQQQVCGLSMSNYVHVTHLDSAMAPRVTTPGGQPVPGIMWLCPGNVFVLGGNDPGPWGLQPTGIWNNGSTAASLTVQDTGVVYISATNACNSDTSTIIHVQPPPDPPPPMVLYRDAFGASVDNLICAGDSVLLLAPEYRSLLYIQNGQTVGYSNFSPFVVSTAGTYQVIGYDNCGHLAPDTTTITIYLDSLPPPDAMILPDLTSLSACYQDTVYLSSNYPHSYWQWLNTANQSQRDTTGQILVDWNIGGNGFYNLYNYNGCGDSQPDHIQTLGAPVPNVQYIETLDTVCLGAGIQPLSVGNPAGGTFSGPGVVGTSFNPAVAGIGAHTVTYSYTEGGCTGIAQSVLYVDGCTGVGSTNDVGGVLFQPNPVHDQLRIFSPDRPMLSYILRDALGRLVSAASLDAEQFILERGDLPSGTYFITITFPDGRVTGKVMMD